MKPFKQRTGTFLKKPVIERIEGIHPYKMITYLLISITCLLYAFICFLFIKHLVYELNGNYDFALPKFFTVSSFLIFVSLFYAAKIVDAYNNDDITKLRKVLSYNLVAGLGFFVSQSLAWIELLQDIENAGNHIMTYVFTLSATHLVYVLAGMILSGILFYRYMLIENDPVKTLIATTNPTEKVKLEVFRIFWNFNALSWTLIFLMLLFIF